jgi:hypothetical protein
MERRLRRRSHFALRREAQPFAAKTLRILLVEALGQRVVYASQASMSSSTAVRTAAW